MSVATDLETLVLGPQHNGMNMTTEEFDAVTDYDDLYKYELIHEVLIVNPIPSAEERGPNEELGHLLFNYRDDHPEGKSLDDTLTEDYIRTHDSRRRADRVVWAGLGRQPDPKNDVPTIVVEFVSEGRRNWKRDYVEKRDEYLAIGVAEYWVIDRFQRILTVFCQSEESEDGWKQTIIRENEVYRPELLLGFELPLARLLAAADRWRSR